MTWDVSSIDADESVALYLLQLLALKQVENRVSFAHGVVWVCSFDS